MAYEKYTWVTGEVITQEKLNHMEDGIADAFTDDMKEALLACFDHVAWTDTDGTALVSALRSALYNINLESLSAEYTQTGEIYTDDTLADIKTAGTLVVTALYSDESTEVIPANAYTLSGSLTEGTSTITVTFGEYTTTFEVTVTAPLYSIQDFAETSITSDGRTMSVKKENGYFTISGAVANAFYVYPNGTVNAARSETLWFNTIQDKPILNQIVKCEWKNPTETDISLDVKYARSDTTGNLAATSLPMAANSEGENASAQFSNDAYNERPFSCLAIQVSNNPSGSTMSATFKVKLFVDGVRYL